MKCRVKKILSKVYISQTMDISKKFDTLRFQHLQMRETLLKALEHVKHFIIRNNLILVGGMAIDLNLRLKGAKLYDEDQIPDYDFLSPLNAEHAYLLGHELCAAKFPAVDVISAIHTTTMKVRVDGHVVADITYCPKTIFDKIRHQESAGIRVIHPFWTMMDQYRSLSIPYENPPNEVISDRWRKDVKRLNLLLDYYPLEEKAKTHPAWSKKLYRVALPALDKPSGIINGWAALAYYQTMVYKDGHHTIPLKYDGTHVEIPEQFVTVMSCEAEAWISRAKKSQRYNGMLSYFRHADINGTVELFDTRGDRITVYDKDPTVASLTSLMLYFMYRWLLCEDALAYQGALAVKSIMLTNTWHLDITPYGDESWSVSALFNIAANQNWDRVKNWKPMNQIFPEDNCEIKRKFDPAQSPLFALDGAKTNEWTEIASPDLLVLGKPANFEK